MLSCHDNFEANFDNYPSMLSYHQALSMASSWRRCKVKDLHVEPLDSASPLYGHPAAFAAGTSEDAIKDTAANLGLALNVDGNIYPVRSTAYKTLTERAKINGTALPKLSRKDLANVLNACLSVHNSDALLLIRNEKVSTVHSGDDSKAAEPAGNSAGVPCKRHDAGLQKALPPKEGSAGSNRHV